MSVDTKKAASYLRYLKNSAALTYRQIEETSGVADSTAQAYFAGRVQTMRQETFQDLVSAISRIIEQRVSDVLHVNTYLMCATSLEHAPDGRHVA